MVMKQHKKFFLVCRIAEDEIVFLAPAASGIGAETAALAIDGGIVLPIYPNKKFSENWKLAYYPVPLDRPIKKE